MYLIFLVHFGMMCLVNLGCSLKFLQLMQHFEHVANPLAEAVQIFTNNLGVKSIAGDIMR